MADNSKPDSRALSPETWIWKDHELAGSLASAVTVAGSFMIVR